MPDMKDLAVPTSVLSMLRLPARRICELMYFSSPSRADAGFAEQNASRGS